MNNELKVELKWLQKVSSYDYPFVVLNRWALSQESRDTVIRLFGEDSDLFPASFFGRAYCWAEENNKFMIEVSRISALSTVAQRNKILILDFRGYEAIQNYVTLQEAKLLADQAHTSSGTI